MKMSIARLFLALLTLLVLARAAAAHEPPAPTQPGYTPDYMYGASYGQAGAGGYAVAVYETCCSSPAAAYGYQSAPQAAYVQPLCGQSAYAPPAPPCSPCSSCSAGWGEVRLPGSFFYGGGGVGPEVIYAGGRGGGVVYVGAGAGASAYASASARVSFGGGHRPPTYRPPPHRKPPGKHGGKGH
ncbi:MAG: hypothetical protein Q8L66_01480 [Caulobacter sp.]|nr:hypothetical protein [Caulobacter sp.]